MKLAIMFEDLTTTGGAGGAPAGNDRFGISENARRIGSMGRDDSLETVDGRVEEGVSDWARRTVETTDEGAVDGRLVLRVGGGENTRVEDGGGGDAAWRTACGW